MCVASAIGVQLECGWECNFRLECGWEFNWSLECGCELGWTLERDFLGFAATSSGLPSTFLPA